MIKRFVEQETLDIEVWGNTIAQYLDAVIYFLIALIILYILQKVVMSRFEKFAKKTKTEIDDVIVEFIYSIRPQLYIVLAAYISLRTLALAPMVLNTINIIVIVVIIFQVTRSIQVIIEFIAQKLSNDEEDQHTKSAARLLSVIVIIIVWIFGILMIFSNIGINVTSLIAGVGIGGIAIAFAMKEILADLFSSFSIYFDKPFKAGDTVKVGEDIGVIQRIGIKTTRVKARTGEQLIVSNQDMTSSRIHNLKRMEHRNARAKFIVEFDTPVEKLKQIPENVKNLIGDIDNVECKRVHLKEFGEWGFIFETLYVVDSSDYTVYMDIQQEINFAITKMLGEMSVQIAVPEMR